MDSIIGIVAGNELEKIYKDRKYKYSIIRYPKKDFINSEGIKKEYGKVIEQKTQYKCYVEKPLGTQFENEVWCTLKDMGFTEMNRDSKCFIKRGDNGIVENQLDVFARYENFIFVIECKTSENGIKRSFSDEIEKLGNIKKDAQTIIYRQFNPRIEGQIEMAWLFVTDGTKLSETDMERAKINGIRVIDNWNYYNKLTLELGEGARYQLFADIFQGRKIQNLIEPVPAIQGSMGGHKYYLFTLTPDDLMKIAFVPHIGKTDEDRLKTFQRVVTKSRIKNISRYITDTGGLFPTNIVVNFETKDKIRFDKRDNISDTFQIGNLYLPQIFKTAYIIDGQHRLFSFVGLRESKVSRLPILAFDNMDFDIQSSLFVDINSEQKGVNRGLLNQISARQNWTREEEHYKLSALPSILILELNKDTNSPFYNKIVLEGEKKKNQKTLTFGAISEELKKLKLFGKRGKGRSKNIYPDLLYYKTIDDSLIQGQRVINNFFNYFLTNSENFRIDWNQGTKGNFSKNGFVIPLLRIMKNILKYIENIEKIEVFDRKMEEFVNKMNDVQKPLCNFFDTMIDLDYRNLIGYGEQGYNDTVITLAEIINREYPFFMPIEIENHHKKERDKQISNFERPLEEIISCGESEIVEFKSTLRTNLITGNRDNSIKFAILKSIAAFLNTKGGILIVGVDDQGNAIGFEEDGFVNEDGVKQYLTNIVSDHLGTVYNTNITTSFSMLTDKKIIMIRCEQSNHPVYLKIEGREKFFIRAGSSSKELQHSEMDIYRKEHFKSLTGN